MDFLNHSLSLSLSLLSRIIIERGQREEEEEKKKRNEKNLSLASSFKIIFV